jgi:hypothetical protein
MAREGFTMKAILYAISIALIAAGVAVGLMVLSNAANVVIGLTLETAAILVSGGFVVLGLASVTAALFAVVDAIEAARRPAVIAAAPETARTYTPAPAVAATAAAGAAGGAFATDYLRRTDEPAAAEEVTAAAVVAEEAEPVEAAAPAEEVAVVEETVVSVPAEATEELVERAYEAAEVVADEEMPPSEEEEVLYVVEEKVIRGKPARILSDGTVEAETDEGWMRFENMEHLEEYLEATQAA